MNIGIVGLGFMGSTHLKALKNISQAKLAAVVSHDPRKLSGDLTAIQGNIGGAGEKYDFSQIGRYSEVDQMLADPNVEAVDICLPTRFHENVTIQALKAGKHVLVEKPMALDGAACRRMIEAAGKADRILMVAQVLRFFPSYVSMRDKLGDLGKVRSAIFRRRCAAPFWSEWLKNKEQSGGGVFDLLIHDVDFAIHLFGLPEAVSAVGYEDLESGIDWITGTLHYPDLDGVVISGGWHHSRSYPFSMEYTVVADGGTIEYHSSHLPPTIYNRRGEALPIPQPEVDGFEAELTYFVDCCARGESPMLCPPGESAAAVEITRLMEQARSAKGEKVPCQL